MTADDSTASGLSPVRQSMRSGWCAAQPALRRLLGALKRVFSWPAVVLLALALAAIHWFDLIALPFPPFGTTGRIYVDSPEVYTRERLVNDRYDEDYWLREQLRKLDDPQALRLPVRSELTQGTVATMRPNGNGEAVPTAETNPGGAPRQLSFEQSLQVASGIRDMIRQQLLENMLDDRHDLTGNSLYGLKFDTTVIPGSNTLRRAFVRVSLTVQDQFPQPERSGSEILEGWKAHTLAPYLTGADQRAQARYARQSEYYDEWLNDIERRLGRAEDSVYESTRDDYPDISRPAFLHKLVGRTLEIVLGIPEETYIRLNLYDQEGKAPDSDGPDQPHNGQHQVVVRLPDPWAKFMQINAKPLDPGAADRSAENGTSTGQRVSFKVSDLVEYLIVAPVRMQAQTSDSPIDRSDREADAAGKKTVTIAITADQKWRIMVPPWRGKMRDQWFDFGVSGPRYPIASTLIETMLDVETQICAQRQREGRPCTEPALDSAERDIAVPSGLFNFIERMAKRDAYAYAIFPKNDVAGVFAETRAQLTAGAGPTGLLDLSRNLAETRTTSVLVGFSDGKAVKADDSVNFGWVISAQGAMEPVLKSQLALISVPAWTDRLDIKVSVGWLDRSGSPELDPEEFDLSVAVPPSYEVFDSIFRHGAEVKLGPTIRDNEMDRAIYVRAGQRAKILIPGARLWRSAAVTLGAQSATRIRVLPNMEGVIAEFDPVDPSLGATMAGESDPCQAQFKAPDGRDLWVRPTRLRVWTSEGMAKAKRPVCVVYDAEDVLGRGPGGPGGSAPTAP